MGEYVWGEPVPLEHWYAQEWNSEHNGSLYLYDTDPPGWGTGNARSIFTSKNYLLPLNLSIVNISVDFRAKSETSDSIVTNTILLIPKEEYSCIEAFENEIYRTFFIWLIAGGTTDTGWQNWSGDITENVTGRDGFELCLGLRDSWSGVYEIENWYDNILFTYTYIQNDSLGNACDNCWYVANPDQNDTNENCPASPYSSDPECGDACEVVCPWDVTDDDYVGIDDIVLVAEHFGEAPGHPDWDPKYDVTGDNYVGIDDIVEVAEHFGESC
jgi:hypothetical protein